VCGNRDDVAGSVDLVTLGNAPYRSDAQRTACRRRIAIAPEHFPPTRTRRKTDRRTDQPRSDDAKTWHRAYVGVVRARSGRKTTAPSR
jgi:hypothetical protein